MASKKQLTCMQLLKRNVRNRCLTALPFLLFTIPVMIMGIREIIREGMEDSSELTPILLCAVIVIYFGISVLISVLELKSPEKSNLGKCILLSSDNNIKDMNELFNIVDSDIERYGKAYGPVTIGNEWVIGKYGVFFPKASAVKISRIKGIFHHFIIRTSNRGLRQFIYIHAVDEKYNDILLRFKKRKHMMEAYEALCKIKPDAANGDQSDWDEYMNNAP